MAGYRRVKGPVGEMKNAVELETLCWDGGLLQRKYTYRLVTRG